MVFSFSDFFVTIGSVLLFIMIFLNGSTDASNAVATVVGTKSLPIKKAVYLSAVCNFFGVIIMCELNTKVADSVFNIANLSGAGNLRSLAVCAAVLAVVVWATLAWIFAIPTSESHALLSALSGSSLAIFGSLKCLNKFEWNKTFIGLILSVLFSFILAFLFSLLLKRFNTDKNERFFKHAQIFGSVVTSFMHGAQDGQKFAVIIILNSCISISGKVKIPFWLSVLCGTFMFLGTAVGGRKIIKNVGENITKMEKYQGFASDISSSIVLFLLTVSGVAVSTTHTKTASVFGTGIHKGMKNVNFNVFFDMMLAWILTFPGCIALGYIFTKIFLLLK